MNSVVIVENMKRQQSKEESQREKEGEIDGRRRELIMIIIMMACQVTRKNLMLKSPNLMRIEVRTLYAVFLEQTTQKIVGGRGGESLNCQVKSNIGLLEVLKISYLSRKKFAYAFEDCVDLVDF